MGTARTPRGTVRPFGTCRAVAGTPRAGVKRGHRRSEGRKRGAEIVSGRLSGTSAPWFAYAHPGVTLQASQDGLPNHGAQGVGMHLNSA
ncbi:hypothetical protein [Streptomyces sp. NPDC056796]|uniref:hypothetical protein n=1 Tax=Streptomyces sp. NPDC056796 TaxID=3345947 RepID=UPI0036A2D558